jgi:hypothetical protein
MACGKHLSKFGGHDMAAGLALSHAIGLAVWKGLVVRSAPFLRTPKLRDAPALLQGLAMVTQHCCGLVV